MKRSTMRFALLAAAVVISALDLKLPSPSGRSPEPLVPPAEASVPRMRMSGEEGRLAATRLATTDLVGRLHAEGAVAAHEAVHATGHIIPADLPQPPLGRFKLTAYSGPQLGQPSAITATGPAARVGRTVAVDPRVIPLGSHIYIEGIGERIAEDVGGGVKGHHIDVYLDTLPQARVFGVQRRTVSVIAPPHEKSAASARSHG